MPKKGIKVRELAQALGITSRTLIDRCRTEGIFVQNSIARISPQSERTVRSWFEQADTDDSDAVAKGNPSDEPDRQR